MAEMLRNIASRNEILVRAGMEPLDPQQTLDDTIAVGRRMEPYIADTARWLYDAWKAGKRILLEGAQGFALDVDQGSYPFVTSSSTGVNGVGPGTGLPPKAVDRVIGIVKAYTTRVGAGPFPTHDVGPAGEHMAVRGKEVGATTGRKRQCGWFDTVMSRVTTRRPATSPHRSAIGSTRMSTQRVLAPLGTASSPSQGADVRFFSGMRIAAGTDEAPVVIPR